MPVPQDAEAAAGAEASPRRAPARQDEAVAVAVAPA
jgi:hypothetical protein